eukprot:g3902.t1
MFRLSKEISYLLRHTSLPQRDPHGWVDIPDLQEKLKHPTSYENIKHVVETNDKKRFVLDESSIPPRIRAAQGHTVQLEDPILEPVTDPETIPFAIHVTSEQGWIGIQTSGALEKRSRTHIHFATSLVHLRKNAWATVYLKLDLLGAMNEGIHFFLSTNRVLLTEKSVPIRYLSQISEREFPQNWS